jgi:hypothetical protein
LRFFYFYFSHGALHPQQQARQRGSINQYAIAQSRFKATTG